MRYIKKTEVPQFFTNDTQSLTSWSQYRGENKRMLREHILANEQNYLCGYCESKVTIVNSHAEHIKPKELDVLNLTFNYQNILVSCNGKCHTTSNSPESCGHKKSNEYDESLFLNPIAQENIRDNFIYTSEGNIKPNSEDNLKAAYMIDLLQLEPSNHHLQEARKKSLLAFRKSIMRYVERTSKDLKEVTKELLNREDLAFISFLRYQYRNML